MGFLEYGLTNMLGLLLAFLFFFSGQPFLPISELVLLVFLFSLKNVYEAGLYDWLCCVLMFPLMYFDWLKLLLCMFFFMLLPPFAIN